MLIKIEILDLRFVNSTRTAFLNPEHIIAILPPTDIQGETQILMSTGLIYLTREKLGEAIQEMSKT